MNDLIDKELEKCVLGACMQKVSVISDLIDMGIDSDSFGDYSLNLWNAENPMSLTHQLVEDVREQAQE